MLGLGAFALSFSPLFCQAVQVDPNLPVQGRQGRLRRAGIGSDTMNNVMQQSDEGFTTFYPNVNAAMVGKGSGDAPPALIEGTSYVRPMSQMKAKELDRSRRSSATSRSASHGARRAGDLRPQGQPDHRGHARSRSTRSSPSRARAGDASDIRTWGTGLTGEWTDKPISLYGRNSASGTYGYFKEHALAKATTRTL